MQFTHEFVVDAPLAVVAEFHRRSASMGAITPPPVIVRIHEAPDLLGEGDEMAFTLYMGPLPIHWRARIEETSATGFVDRQLSGPYAAWVHRHRFEAIDESTTRVHDQVEAELPASPFWRLVCRGMWLNMPMLFAFRAWKTKRLLRKKQNAATVATPAP